MIDLSSQPQFLEKLKNFTMMFSSLTPANTIYVLRTLNPWIGGLFALFLTCGLYFALIQSPIDYQQGEMVRLMYVHVPASWLCVIVYILMAMCAAIGFITKHPLFDLIIKAAAPIGASFTLISLITGSLWGKPMWGTWWVWDARLTSVFILLLLYLGYIILVDAYQDSAQGLKFGSILILLGAVNIPIIKWSVTWWTTLHQPASLLRLGGSAIHGQMLVPLGLMGASYGLFYLWILGWRLESEILKRKIKAHEHRQDHDTTNNRVK